jgi:RNA polymerase sigma-70 factor, ECF subfamily
MRSVNAVSCSGASALEPAAPASETRAVALSGTPLTFATLAEAHLDFVFRSLRRFGLDEEAADDAVQQVFLIAASKIDSIVCGKEKAFLYGVAKNVAAQSRRAHARRRQVDLSVLEEDADADPGHAAPSLDDLVDQSSARALLDEVLGELPEKLRDVFVLSEIEELTATEAALCLDIPVGTVASRLAKARALFDDKLARIEMRREARGAR